MSRFYTNTLYFLTLYLLLFSVIFIIQKNFEFIVYVAVVLFFATLLFISNKRGIKYSNTSILLLAAWGFLHMLGGTEIGNGKIVYDLMLIDVVGEPFDIFKYDQLVHFFGFGAATITLFDIIKSSIPNVADNKSIIIFFVVLGSMGLGALNEIIEFILSASVENTNVGGYENNALDLIFNTLGALAATVYLLKYRFKNGKEDPNTN